MRHPSAVQNEIYRQIEANENRKFDRVGISAAAGNAGGRTARRLDPGADPRARRAAPQGLLTDAEFAAKKQQLLDRM